MEPHMAVGNDRDLSAGPTRDERDRLAHAYQSRALRQPDLLVANLGVLAGDLILLAHAARERVRAAQASGDTRFGEAADLYLKVLRQFDRFAQIERQVTAHRPRPSVNGQAESEESGV
jgi:hypothetical protein